MRTLALGIAAIFGLGIALGSFVMGASKTAPSVAGASLEEALAAARLVDCGEGRKALVEPVVSNGEVVGKVTCAAIDSNAGHEAANAAVTRPVYAPAPARAQATANAPPARRNEDVGDREEKRSWQDSALIIGSSAGAGAGIGAIAKGGKGAAVGAAIGGVAGTVYDLSTRNKKK